MTQYIYLQRLKRDYLLQSTRWRIASPSQSEMAWRMAAGLCVGMCLEGLLSLLLPPVLVSMRHVGVWSSISSGV